MGLQADHEPALTNSDIMTLHAALQLAQRNVLRYQALVEQAPISIVVFSVQTWLLVNANPAFQQLIGYSADEILALTLHDILVTPSKNLEDELRRMRRNDGVSRQEMLIRHKTGEILQVELNLIPPQADEADKGRQIHQAIPADRQRAGGKGDRIEVGMDQHEIAGGCRRETARTGIKGAIVPQAR